MTIKQYDCTNGGYQYCSGCYQMSQGEYGDYVRVDDLRERLDDLLFNNINEACDIMSFLYKLHEELQ